jgi:hypothetical protein
MLARSVFIWNDDSDYNSIVHRNSIRQSDTHAALHPQLNVVRKPGSNPFVFVNR